MREKVGFVVCFWFLLCGSYLGRFVVERNSLKVTSLDSLKGVYESAIGNFGVPQYGGTMVGIVVYAKANQKACKSFSDVHLSFKPKPGGLPIFLIADRLGIEVKPGSPYTCQLDPRVKLHISQGWKVTLLESISKRCVFLEYAVDLTGLSNVQVVRERAEVWDLVTGRLLQTRAFPLPITAIVVDPTEMKLFSSGIDY
ncbi:unnamed protein product [Camellia sinensis]